MFKDVKAFSSFSVNNLDEAKAFYGQTLGLETDETQEGLALKIAGGGQVFLYPKPDHTPASFTVLNFPTDDIDAAVDKLGAQGITFESYGGDIETDAQGIFRGASSGEGPNIAWFKDPAGNILSVVEEKKG